MQHTFGHMYLPGPFAQGPKALGCGTGCRYRCGEWLCSTIDVFTWLVCNLCCLANILLSSACVFICMCSRMCIYSVVCMWCQYRIISGTRRSSSWETRQCPECYWDAPKVRATLCLQSSWSCPSLLLWRLSGRKHVVYTGVTLVYRGVDGTLLNHCFHEATEVTFATLTGDIIQSYVASNEPLWVLSPCSKHLYTHIHVYVSPPPSPMTHRDKAGAYLSIHLCLLCIMCVCVCLYVCT